MVVIGSFFGVILHELAHILTALALGVTVKRVGLSWKGPYIVREPGTPWENVGISLAGPLMNIALAALFWHSNWAVCWPNLVLAIHNLLPLRGTDGQRALRLLAVLLLQ